MTSPEDADQQIRRIQDLLLQGKKDSEIVTKLDIPDIDEWLSIAKARLKSDKTANDYFMLEEDLRFATNELVADHRAKRLACDTLVEIGCGIGIQTIAFAKTCKKVIAIDIDERKVTYAKANAQKRKITNVEFIAGDGIAILNTLKHADVVFCDPGRPASEHIRDINTSFSPNIPTLIETAQRLTKNIAIEFPPQIVISDSEWEFEYLSINHQLNRLTAYLGTLAKTDVSVTILPENATLQGLQGRTNRESSRPLKYLYEVDPAVLKAGLVWRIPGDGLFHITKDTLTSMDEIKSPFFKGTYRVVTVTKKIQDAKQVLKRERAGKVVLHGNIKPDEYWAERKRFEEGLEGKRVFHVFIDTDIIVCKSLDQ